MWKSQVVKWPHKLPTNLDMVLRPQLSTQGWKNIPPALPAATRVPDPFFISCPWAGSSSRTSSWKSSPHCQLGQHYPGKGDGWGCELTGGSYGILPAGAGHLEGWLQQPWVPRKDAGPVPRTAKGSVVWFPALLGIWLHSKNAVCALRHFFLFFLIIKTLIFLSSTLFVSLF